MNFDKIPRDLVVYILSFLSPTDLQSIKQASRFFHARTNENILYKKKLELYFPHHMPPFEVADKYDYKALLLKAMKDDYRLGVLDDKPFSIDEIAIFNSCKIGDLKLFYEKFSGFCENKKNLEKFVALSDKTSRNFIQWAGYFGHQEILNYVFKELSKYFLKRNQLDHEARFLGFNYFYVALLCNQLDVLNNASDEQLLEINNFGFGIFGSAISCCHNKLLEYLLNVRRFDINMPANRRKPIHFAAAFGNSETLALVIPTAPEDKGDILRMFIASIECNNTAGLQYLLKLPCDVNVNECTTFMGELGNVFIMASSNKKEHALKSAISKNRPFMAIMLLKKDGCKSNCLLDDFCFKNPYIFSPAINQALSDLIFRSISKVYLDINSEWNLNKRDEFGNTIFHWIAYCNQVETLMLIRDKNPLLPNEANDSKQFPAQLAAICGHQKILEIYLMSDLNINFIDGKFVKYGYGDSLLNFACQNGHENIVEFLASCPEVNINLADNHWNTPLMWSIEKGLKNIVTILLEAGADIHTKNLQDMTPLTCAAREGQTEILKMLLDHAHFDDGQIQHALKYAQQNGHRECSALLKGGIKTSCLVQ